MARTHKANVHGAAVGRGGLTDQMAARRTASGKTVGGKSEQQTSIFDPVLCELAYRWHCPPEGKVLDPFAGGSVRGIVAAMLGREYTGIELRPEQVEANREQAETLLDAAEGSARWIIGDSMVVISGPRRKDHDLQTPFDFVFTCPPYADLEVYSQNERDLSNMNFTSFMRAFEDIMGMCYDALDHDRFAAIVIGDARDKRNGFYYGLPARTIVMMQDIGFGFLAEYIIATPPGSLPGRSRIPFEKSRKPGRQHQVMLVFVKGSAERAAATVGPVEFGEGDPLANDDALASAIGELS